MHFQRAPHEEAKVVRCIRGAIFDVIVDLRAGSRTLGRWVGCHLDQENGAGGLRPRGLRPRLPDADRRRRGPVHDLAPVRPEASTGVRWDDPAFGIEWPDAPAADDQRARPLLAGLRAAARRPVVAARGYERGLEGDQLHHPAGVLRRCGRGVGAGGRAEPVLEDVAVGRGDDPGRVAAAGGREVTGRRPGSDDQIVRCGRRRRAAVGGALVPLPEAVTSSGLSRSRPEYSAMRTSDVRASSRSW